MTIRSDHSEENFHHETKDRRRPEAGLYYVIPSFVFECDELSHSEVVFYGFLSGLATREGYCFASDEYLAERMKVSLRSIQEWLKKMEKLRFIKRETEKNGMHWNRKIFVLNGYSKNSYEQKPAAVSNSAQPLFDIAPSRDIISKEILSKDINLLPPLTPPSNKPLQKPIPPTKEEEEEIEKRFKERPKESKPVIVKSAWKSKVLKKMREESAQEKESKKIALKHEIQARSYDCQKFGRSTVYACPTCVEITWGSFVKRVSYDMTDEEWYKETGFPRED